MKKKLKAKQAAAIAAVTAYIKTEQEAICRAGLMPQTPYEEAPKAPPVRISLWGMSGRQDMMQMRNMMQMKAFQTRIR